MRCVKKFAPPFVAAALFVLFAVMVNSTKAQCPCTVEKTGDVFAIATETPDATANPIEEPPAPPVGFDMDELARNDASPGEVHVVPPGSNLTREALPMHNPKAITEDGLIDLNLDHELARQEVLAKRERITSDPRFKAMTATLDENSEEYEMCATLTQYIFDTIERVENPEENTDPEHVEMQRSTLADAVNDIRKNGGNPEPFRELIEAAGGDMDRDPTQSLASNDDCPDCPKNTLPFILSPDLPTSYEESLEYEPQELDTAEFRRMGFDPITGAELPKGGDDDEK